MRLRFAALSAVVMAAQLVATGSPAAAATPGDTLTSGHMLVASYYGDSPRSQLRSRNGEFTLIVTGTSAAVDQTLYYADGTTGGMSIWWQFAYPTGYDLNDKTTLRMQSDGNLVLLSSTRRLIWQSHTAHTGTHNYLRLLDNGNLVIRTAQGRTVWQSGTTRAMFGPGAVISSGRVLVNRYRERFVPPTYLVMRRDGNLVVIWRGRVTWSSGTHVPGSWATLSKGGDLKIYSPSNRLLWHSHTRGERATLTVEQCGQISISTLTSSRGWVAPIGAPQTCG